MREIEIADLLRREQVVSGSDTAQYLRDRTVLVTGAGGSIGSELSRQVASAGVRSLVLLGHGENSLFEGEAQLRRAYPTTTIHVVVADVRDRDRLAQVFAAYRPSVRVPRRRPQARPPDGAQPGEAVTNNILGTRNVADLAVEFGVSRSS